MKRFLFLVFLVLVCEFRYTQTFHITFHNDDLSAKSDPVFEYQVLKIFLRYEIKPLFAVIPVIGGTELVEGMAIVDSLRSWQNKGWIDIGMHGDKHEYKFNEFDEIINFTTSQSYYETSFNKYLKSFVMKNRKINVLNI